MGSDLGSSGSTRRWRATRAAVLDEEPLCRWCGQPSETADHILPRAHGGDDRRENLTGACTACNLARGAGGGNAPPSLAW
jgi:5-methylcytosine-specific restriction endonuclease McrA